MISLPAIFSFFFFNDTATTEIYTLSLHDALPISKATDIARNCGLGVFRVERITEYRIAFKTGLLSNVLGSAPELSAEQTARIAALLHDRMTESVFATRAEAEQIGRAHV